MCFIYVIVQMNGEKIMSSKPFTELGSGKYNLAYKLAE